MGTKYTTTAVSGYNATPPADDGTQVAANKVTWAKHKTKLGDPLNTAIASINTKLVAALAHGPTAVTGTYTTDADDYDTVLECSGTFTVTMLAAASAAAGYFVTIKNAGTGIVTVAATETIDGFAAIALHPGRSVTVMVNAAADKYVRIGTVDSGDWRYVGRQTGSTSATLEFIDLEQASDHKFVLRLVRPDTDAVTLHMRVSADAGAGPTYGTSYENMSFGRQQTSSAGAFTTLEQNLAVNFQLGVFSMGVAVGAEFGATGFVQIDEVSSSVSSPKIFSGNIQSLDESSVASYTTICGQSNAKSAVQAVEFFFSAGNILQGSIDHYIRRVQT